MYLLMSKGSERPSKSLLPYHLLEIAENTKMGTPSQGNLGPYEIIDWVEPPKVAIGK